jgi:hypothetical protein
MSQVFISYSRRDLSFVEQLVSDLKRTGIDVWYDLSGLEGGSRWRIEIQKAIKNSDFVIVVISPDSVESEWVEREYLFASNLKKKILPIMYRECELPMSFLDLNYVDAQGDNYSQNFDKITRFLDREALPASSLENTWSAKRLSVASFVGLGTVAVLGILAFFLLNGRNVGNDSPLTSTPQQTPVEGTATSESGMSSVVATATAMQPESTSTQPPAPVVMTTPFPTVAGSSAQVVYIQAAVDGNMAGHWTGIDHDLSNDPNAFVFAVPNWNPPGGPQVYNKHLIGVWYTGSQWSVINQDMQPMPQDAAFNIQIFTSGTNVFLHRATASNTSENWTTIDNPLAEDPDALVFVMPNWSPPDGNRKYNVHPIGVWYTGTKWAIFNQDMAAMSVGASFNVQIVSSGMNAFVHTATASNTKDNWTAIDDPFAYDPNKLVFVMPRSLPGEDGIRISHPIGVWYSGTKWAVFNEDMAAMPEGAEFNVLILDAR